MSDICIIGTGNVAWHMNRLCQNGGHAVVQILGRSIENASSIASGDFTQLTDNPSTICQNADVYLICVNDSSIVEVVSSVRDFIPKNALVMHTSGTQSIHALEPLHAIVGSIWPIQSLTAGIAVDADKIPIAISANSASDAELISNFIKTLGTPFQIVDENNKTKLHLAAVVVNNFTNHLIALTQGFMKVEKLDFALVKPLLEFTIEKLDNAAAIAVQTGPARRGDLETIQQHLKLLDNQPALQNIYKLISESIAETYNNNNKP